MVRAEGGAGRHTDLPSGLGTRRGPGQPDWGRRPQSWHPSVSQAAPQGLSSMNCGRDWGWTGSGCGPAGALGSRFPQMRTHTCAHSCPGGNLGCSIHENRILWQTPELLFPWRRACSPRVCGLGPGRVGPAVQGPGPASHSTPVCWACLSLGREGLGSILLLDKGLEGPQGEVGRAGSLALWSPGNSLGAAGMVCSLVS